MSSVPVTEEDKPSVESMILRIKRLRKREAAQQSRADNGKSYGNPYLDDAIEGLMEYGAIKGWWEYDKF